jgi:hypothetical protein
MRRAAFGGVRELTENCMLDILMLAIGIGFFALLACYGIASERL